MRKLTLHRAELTPTHCRAEHLLMSTPLYVIRYRPDNYIMTDNHEEIDIYTGIHGTRRVDSSHDYLFTDPL